MSTVDTAAESAARAAQVTAPNTFEGVQPPSGSDGAEDAALDALMAQHGMGDGSDDEAEPEAYTPPPAAPEREEAKEHRSEETPPAPANAEGKTDPQAPAAMDQSVIAARRALMRDGWSIDQLDKLSPEMLMEVGALRGVRQVAVDKLLDDRSRQLDPKTQATKSETGENAEGTPKSRSEPTSDGRLTRAQQVLADAFGDDAVGAEVLAALQDVIGGTPPDRVPAHQGDGAMAEVLLERQARARLSDVYPQLKSDAGLGHESAAQSDAIWNQITADAEQFFHRQVSVNPDLTTPQRAALIERCHDQAAGLHLGAPISDARRAELRSIAAAKGQGGISIPVGKVDPSETFDTADKFEEAWFNAKWKDKDPARVAALEKLLPSLTFR